MNIKFYHPFRYELRQQYEQNFTEAIHCLPFECKPSHKKT